MKKLLGILAVAAGAAAVVAHQLNKEKKINDQEIEHLVADEENQNINVEEKVECLSKEENQKLNELCQRVYESIDQKNDDRKERPLQHIVQFTEVKDLEFYKDKVIKEGYVVTSGKQENELIVLNITKVDYETICKSVFYLAEEAKKCNGSYIEWMLK